MSALDRFRKVDVIVKTSAPIIQAPISNPFASLEAFELAVEESNKEDEIIIGSHGERISEVNGIPLQRVPRTTLLLMLKTAKLEEHFTFNTKKNNGPDFVQAMRAVLSRTRAKAINSGRELENWKLFTVKITQFPTHDEVTLLRTKIIKKLANSVYSELVEALEHSF